MTWQKLFANPTDPPGTMRREYEFEEWRPKKSGPYYSIIVEWIGTPVQDEEGEGLDEDLRAVQVARWMSLTHLRQLTRAEAQAFVAQHRKAILSDIHDRWADEAETAYERSLERR